MRNNYLFKDISYVELWQPLCSVEQNHLCNFGRRHHEEQFWEFFFEFGPVVQEEMLFKDISYLSIWQLFVQRKKTFVQFW